MTNQSTIDKLIEMRLTSMADAFRNQINDPNFKDIPFEDQFGAHSGSGTITENLQKKE